LNHQISNIDQNRQLLELRYLESTFNGITKCQCVYKGVRKGGAALGGCRAGYASAPPV